MYLYFELKMFNSYFYVESTGSCSDNNACTFKILFLLTFGNRRATCSNKTLYDYNFNIEYKQSSNGNKGKGTFSFVNKVPVYLDFPPLDSRHFNRLNATENDTNGCMFFVKSNQSGEMIFEYEINHFCIGRRYEFSASLTNALKAPFSFVELNIHFEVRSTNKGDDLIVNSTTM